jgi:hypothetical protein
MQTGIRLFTDYDMRYVHGKTWKNSFYYGAIATISERLNATKKNLSTDQNINALIVLSDKEVTDYISKTWPKIGTNNASYNIMGSAYNSGKEAGRSISFRQGMGGSHDNGNLLKS